MDGAYWLKAETKTPAGGKVFSLTIVGSPVPLEGNSRGRLKLAGINRQVAPGSVDRRHGQLSKSLRTPFLVPLVLG